MAFRSGSGMGRGLGCSGLECALPAAVGFCTRRDSETVVACARLRCNRLGMFWTGARRILVGLSGSIGMPLAGRGPGVPV